MRPLPALLLTHPANAEIVRYLQNESPPAHSDLTSEMFLAAQGLRDVHSFAPDPAAYSYELLHTSEGVIISVAVGQSTILVRAPDAKRTPDHQRRGAAVPHLGPAWTALPAFQPDVPLAEWRAFLSRMLKRAFRSAF